MYNKKRKEERMQWHRNFLWISDKNRKIEQRHRIYRGITRRIRETNAIKQWHPWYITLWHDSHLLYSLLKRTQGLQEERSHQGYEHKTDFASHLPFTFTDQRLSYRKKSQENIKPKIQANQVQQRDHTWSRWFNSIQGKRFPSDKSIKSNTKDGKGQNKKCNFKHQETKLPVTWGFMSLMERNVWSDFTDSLQLKRREVRQKKVELKQDPAV